jgi:hypothetical protein
MLISMPTCTSTIFGFFQAIAELPSQRHDCRSKYDKVTPKVATDAMLFHRLLPSIVGRRMGIVR